MIADLLISCGAAVLASFVLTRVAGTLLPRVGLVSNPDPHHPHPVPVGGGIAIWLAIGGTLLGLVIFGHDLSGVGVPLLGAAALFVAGLWDDVRLLDPRTKLLIQFGVAGAMVIGGVTFPLGPDLEWVAVPVTMLWFVGVCNAFNLVDNMDGMLPGVAVVAAIFVGLFAYATGRTEAALVSWVAGAAVLGFLPANLPPARIFMGDSGSMSLGFLMAGLAIGDSWAGSTQLAFTILAPSLLLAVPIFNTTFVTVTRKLSGIPLSRGKADHINYRLLAHGMSRGRALLSVYVLSAVSGTVGVLVVSSTPMAYAVGASLFLTLLMYIGVFLYEGRTQDFEREFQVPKARPGWEESPWYRWVIRVVAVVGDVVLVFASMYMAFYLRFDGSIPSDQLANLATVLPYILVIRVGFALLFGVYEIQWRLGMASDGVRLVGSVVIGSLLFAAILFVLPPPSFPRTVVVMEGLLSLLFFGLTRVGVRALGEVTSREWGSREGLSTIVAGSSDGLMTVLRHLRRRTGPPYHVIGFASEDPSATSGLVGGIRVLGPASRITALARLYGADHIIFCFPTMADEDLVRLVRGAMAAGLTSEIVRMEILPADEWMETRGSEDQPPASVVAVRSGE